VPVSVENYVFCFKTLSGSRFIKLRNWNALRKHSLHGKLAASVLLKEFISGKEIYHATEAP